MNISGFKIIRSLSQGSMANVYLAAQKNLDREVALKIMSQNLLKDPSFKQTFLNEGRIVAKLHHPHIITIYDLGYAADGCYISMEYVAGKNLKERIQAGLTLGESLQIAVRVARALDYAHKCGIVHRDIKPTNILFRDYQYPVLTDFGIAQPQTGGLSLSPNGAFIGTPRYLSPERVKGEPEDARSDLYSLGAVFYEMITGHPPYEGEEALATALKHLHDPVPELAEPFAFLQPVLDRLMAKEPAHRFGSAQEFIHALEQVMRDQGEESATLFELAPGPANIPRIEPLAEAQAGTRNERIARRPGGLRQGWWSVHRNRWSLAGVAIGVAAIAGGYYWQQSRSDLQTQHVLEQLLAYEGTQPTQSLVSQPGVRTPYATYTFALALAQGQPEVLEGLRKLAGRFEERARRKWQEGQLDQALMLVKQGLHFKPDHKGLLALKPFMTQQIGERRRQHQLKELLVQARQHLAQSRLTEPKGNNAFDTYNAVLALDRKNQEALKGLTQIAQHFEQRAREAHNRGDISGSLALIEQGIHIDPKHSGLHALKDSVDRRSGERDEKRLHLIAQWLERAQAQFQAGRLAQPPGDNAFETYRLILVVAPGEAGALTGIQRIAERYQQLAQIQKTNGDLKASQFFIEQGLQTIPGHMGLVALKDQIASSQGETIQSLLKKAEQQFVSSQLTEPKGGNAFESYKEILRLDPGNQKAREGLQMIVHHYQTLAEGRQQAGNLQEALVLVNEGLKIEPDNGGLLAQQKALLVALKAPHRLTNTQLTNSQLQ
jgi:serine/threonine-protein kinase PpkA